MMGDYLNGFFLILRNSKGIKQYCQIEQKIHLIIFLKCTDRQKDQTVLPN